MRRVRGSVIVGVVVVLMLPHAVVPAVSAHQPDSSADIDLYRSVIREYRATVDAGASVKPLIGWQPEQIEKCVKAVIARADTPELEAAAALNLEIGIAVVGLSVGSATTYFEHAADLIAATLPPPQIRKGLSAERLADIAEATVTVIRVAASAFLSANDVQAARVMIARARRVTPRSPAVLTLGAAIDMVDANAIDPQVWDTPSQQQRTKRDRTLLLMRADEALRNALELDPSYALARIELGRVQHLQNRRREARESLEAGRAAAREPRHRFLAAMFTGALQQDENDLAGARRSFLEAHAIVPQSQNAVVALSYLELMSGRVERARDVAREYASARQDNTWWAYKSGVLDLEGLRWLRTRVHQ